MSEPITLTFQIQRRDDDGNTFRIGALSVDERGQLVLNQTEPAFAAVLRKIVDTINGLPELRIKSPPPDAEAGGIAWRSVPRDAPDFVAALGEFFEQKYNLVLCNE